MSGLKSLTNDQVLEQVELGYFEICGERIELEEVRIIYGVAETIGEHFEAHSDNQVLVLMDMQQDEQLWDEGLAREVINRIQKLKKKADLIPTDAVTIYYELKDEDKQQMQRVISVHNDMIVNTVKSKLQEIKEKTQEQMEIIKEIVQIKQFCLELTICSLVAPENLQKHQKNNKNCKKSWLNLVLAEDIACRFAATRKASLFLEDLKLQKRITLEELKLEICNLFGLYGLEFNLKLWNAEKKNCSNLMNLNNLNNDLLFVTRKKDLEISEELLDSLDVKRPFCAFVETKDQDFRFLENPIGVNL